MNDNGSNDDQRYLVFQYTNNTTDMVIRASGANCFNKQSEAIEFYSSHPDQKVFSYEVMGPTRVYRKFVVCDIEIFWNTYEKCSDKNFYQVIVEGTPVKLFFDVEFWRGPNQEKDGEAMCLQLLAHLDHMIQSKFNQERAAREAIILDSSDDTKFSRHIIFRTVVLKDMKHCGQFVTEVVSSLTESDRKLFEVKTFDGRAYRSFIDTSVYTSNRHLRVFLSSKYGQDRPLRCNNPEMFTASSSTCDDIDVNRKILFESLVVNSTKGPGELLSCDDREVQKKSDHVKSYTGQGSSVQSSPYKNIDKYVEKLADPGRVRKITWNDVKQTVRYDIVGNRYCRMKDGVHEKNNIYYKYFARNHRLIQDCYSPSCNFKRIHEVPIELNNK